jgi:hypothetical protein
VLLVCLLGRGGKFTRIYCSIALCFSALQNLTLNSAYHLVHEVQDRDVMAVSLKIVTVLIMRLYNTYGIRDDD